MTTFNEEDCLFVELHFDEQKLLNDCMDLNFSPPMSQECGSFIYRMPESWVTAIGEARKRKLRVFAVDDKSRPHRNRLFENFSYRNQFMARKIHSFLENNKTCRKAIGIFGAAHLTGHGSESYRSLNGTLAEMGIKGIFSIQVFAPWTDMDDPDVRWAPVDPSSGSKLCVNASTDRPGPWAVFRDKTPHHPLVLYGERGKNPLVIGTTLMHRLLCRDDTCHK